MRDTFIRNLYRKAREYEVLDINNSRKSFIRRNGRYMLSTLVALIVLFTLPCGYTQEFLQLASTILSIFIGLLLTVLVFALDKFYGPDRLGAKDIALAYMRTGIHAMLRSRLMKSGILTPMTSYGIRNHGIMCQNSMYWSVRM